MSRGQSSQVFSTASGQNATNSGNAQSAFGAAQNDINNYSNNLASFVSGNPYTAGGEYDRTINAGLANTSDAGANSLAGALQSQAKRTGQNSAADAATAASNAQQNTRNLSSSLASAQQQRISNEAGYNQQALQASEVPAQLESSLYSSAGSQANQELGTEEQASQTPSFWDTIAGNLASGLGRGIGAGVTGGVGNVIDTGNWGNSGGGGGRGGCWVAAEIYGGWHEPRTVLVRAWLNDEFCDHWYGRAVMWVYGLTGKPIAALLHRVPVLKPLFRPLFDAALRAAQSGTRAAAGKQ